jgi:hypothetical protein
MRSKSRNLNSNSPTPRQKVYRWMLNLSRWQGQIPVLTPEHPDTGAQHIKLELGRYINGRDGTQGCTVAIAVHRSSNGHSTWTLKRGYRVLRACPRDGTRRYLEETPCQISFYCTYPPDFHQGGPKARFICRDAHSKESPERRPDEHQSRPKRRAQNRMAPHSSSKSSSLSRYFMMLRLILLPTAQVT